MLKIKALLFSLFLFAALSEVSAQGQGNTPFSVYGIGELDEQSSAAQFMMGGTGASFSNAFYLNRINPALLVKNRVASGLKYVSFNVGFRGNSRTITTESQARKEFGFNINHLSLTAPMTANWAMGLVLSPYSTVDYETKYSKPIVGSVSESLTYENRNSGGVARISYLNSFRLFKSLYLGVEGNYHFGSIRKDSANYIFNDITNQLRTNTRYDAKGFGLKLGLAYQQKINQKWQVNIGGAYEFGSRLFVNELKTSATYADLGQGSFPIQKPDTLKRRTFYSGIPPQYTVGISLESPFHWVFAVDYHTTKWENQPSLDPKSKDVLTNSESLHFGVEYLPNSSSTKYFNQVFYRVGFMTGKTPYIFDNTQITDNRITFGLSVPMGFRNPSYMNFGFGIGRRGTTANHLVQENYLRFSISTSLLSPWFIKPRID